MGHQKIAEHSQERLCHEDAREILRASSSDALRMTGFFRSGG